MSEQRTDAAERSAHVTRGRAAAPKSPDPFTGPEFGPLKLRAVADRDEQIARFRELLVEARAALSHQGAQYLADRIESVLNAYPERP